MSSTVEYSIWHQLCLTVIFYKGKILSCLVVFQFSNVQKQNINKIQTIKHVLESEDFTSCNLQLPKTKLLYSHHSLLFP